LSSAWSVSGELNLYSDIRSSEKKAALNERLFK
jgi:hypothetical protein